MRKRIYRLTARLPDHEKFNLVSQMRRAAVSVTNSIAEGHGSRSFRHNISYLYRVRGSLNELVDDLNICVDEDYFAAEHIDDLRKDIESVIRLTNGYIRYLRKRLNADSAK